MDRSEVIRNGKGLLDEKGLEEKVLEEVAMATGEGCYGDGRWLLSSGPAFIWLPLV